MSIDGIGKRGGVAPGTGASGAIPAQSSFELNGVNAARAVGAPSGSDAFSALERGDINVEQYLDARVENAVAPLASKLSPEQLQFVRDELRGALETDPVLLELVRKTTGRLSDGG